MMIVFGSDEFQDPSKDELVQLMLTVLFYLFYFKA